MAEQKEKQAPTARRDSLIQHEIKAQQLWESKKFHESSPDMSNAKKFFVTFPYPYMNGRLHLGHAFSLSKCEFATRYKKLQGYNVLFPFSFHCTGMPISAAAKNLTEEITQYGNPPQLPKREDKKKYQYEILEQMNIPQDQIDKFQNPKYWLEYFPPYGQQDLKKFGVNVDFRRSFITTDVNPYYNSFVEWQFNTLREQGKVVFGKRPSIFSPKDNQMCADHDRQEGEEFGPQEYTLIKLKVLEFPNEMECLKGRDVFLCCATLRPETMYGQTNCYVLPTGTYGAFEMRNGEVFICSSRAALNMAFQDMTAEYGKVSKICDISGQTLLGLPLRAPLTSYEKVYALPMLTVSMDKGTGIVTSVPSDSPDDYAALRDLKNKKPLREKYGITDEMVLPYDIIEIIEIPEYENTRQSAVKACDEFKVTSQNDKKGLEEAKAKTYKLGFYKGIFLVKDYEGKKVCDCKDAIRKQLIDSNDACVYWEPEGKIISRLGDECVVTLCDQWYLNYADQEWKDLLKTHCDDKNKFWCFHDNVQQGVLDTIDWLKEWGCSRSFGLGTKLPWDQQYLIESLSDSTIYMAYYTVSYLFQGELNGSVPGSLNIQSSEISHSDWDYIFLNKPYSTESKIPEEKLAQARAEFRYWYPMDLRCSGKDLIKNHLTMSLFNHSAIWKDEPSLWPKGFFANGWVLVDKVKMSKSLGNFLTIDDLINRFGCDASRISLATAGDHLDDANFEIKATDTAILALYSLEQWIRETVNTLKECRTSAVCEQTKFFDAVFDAEQKHLVRECEHAYETMQYRQVVKYGFFEFHHLKEHYRMNCGSQGYRKDLILQYMELCLIMIYPLVFLIMFKNIRILIFYICQIIKQYDFISKNYLNLFKNKTILSSINYVKFSKYFIISKTKFQIVKYFKGFFIIII